MRPSRRKEMAIKAVKERGICIRVACQAFGISESCYRYERKLDAENEEVATWLIKLTDNNRNWGFGLCYLYLRNLKGFKWNHKRVYRVYKELELNLRIKPRKLGVGVGVAPLDRTHYCSVKGVKNETKKRGVCARISSADG